LATVRCWQPARRLTPKAGETTIYENSAALVMSLFRLDASILPGTSTSAELADLLEAE
jgi:hypothetical protein